MIPIYTFCTSSLVSFLVSVGSMGLPNSPNCSDLPPTSRNLILSAHACARFVEVSYVSNAEGIHQRFQVAFHDELLGWINETLTHSEPTFPFFIPTKVGFIFASEMKRSTDIYDFF